jgi:hypothetical protein
MGQSSSAFMAKPTEPQLRPQDNRLQLLLECPTVTREEPVDSNQAEPDHQDDEMEMVQRLHTA